MNQMYHLNLKNLKFRLHQMNLKFLKNQMFLKNLKNQMFLKNLKNRLNRLLDSKLNHPIDELGHRLCNLIDLRIHQYLMLQHLYQI